MLLRMNKVQQAKETLYTCTRLQDGGNKDGAQHYTMLATIEMESGNVTAARELLSEGSIKYPGDQFLLQRWGVLEGKHGNIAKARELFERSILLQPHAPTFVAWAILEENEGLKRYEPAVGSIVDELVDSDAPRTGMLIFENEDDVKSVIKRIPSLDDVYKQASTYDAEVLPGSSGAAHTSMRRKRSDFTALESTSSLREIRSVAAVYNKEQVAKARELYSVGMEADPQHGPLYHAFGNMEMVAA